MIYGGAYSLEEQPSFWWTCSLHPGQQRNARRQGDKTKKAAGKRPKCLVAFSASPLRDVRNVRLCTTKGIDGGKLTAAFKRPFICAVCFINVQQRRTTTFQICRLE